MYSLLLRKILTISNSIGLYLSLTCVKFDPEKQLFSFVASKRTKIKILAALQVLQIIWLTSKTAHTYFFKPRSEFPLPYIICSLYITLTVVFIIEFHNVDGYHVVINQIYFYFVYFKSKI